MVEIHKKKVTKRTKKFLKKKAGPTGEKLVKFIKGKKNVRSAKLQKQSKAEAAASAATIKEKQKQTEELLSKQKKKDQQRKDDFLGEENLGELDMDTFFEKVAEKVEETIQKGGDEDDDDDQVEMDEDSDDDDDGSDSEEDGTPEKSSKQKSAEKKQKKKKSSKNESSDSESEMDGEDEDERKKSKSKLKKEKTMKRSQKGKKAKAVVDDKEDDDDDNSSLEDIADAEARMKAEMAKIAETDPEFHEFLQENESSLLKFGSDDEEDEEELLEDDDEEMEKDVDEEDDEEGKKGKKERKMIVLTMEGLKNLARGVFVSKSIKTLKKLMSAFKAACHLADTATDEDEKRFRGESGTSYHIESSKVFDQLMVMCFTRVHSMIRYHLLEAAAAAESETTKKEQKKGQKDKESTTTEKKDEEVVYDENTPINPKKMENSPNWISIRHVILTFFKSTLHLLEGTKEPQLLEFIIKSLSHYVTFLTPLPNIAEQVLRSLTAFWSAPLDASESYQVVRLAAFLRIRQMALTQPFPFVESCMKKTYLAFANRAKFGSGSYLSATLPTLTVMGNCLVELYSLDYHSSYQHAFVYIRQLALYLRNAMQKRTTEAMQKVYCWQYIHCLNLWVAVLAEAAASSDDGGGGGVMRSLIYPLVEVIMGVARLLPLSTRFLPIKFHCVRMLQKLAAATEVFVPTTFILLDIMDLKEWYQKPKKVKGGKTAAIYMQYMIKLPKTDALRTKEQLDAGTAELFQLLVREIELYRYSAGFPEYSVRIVMRMKQYSKQVGRLCQRERALAKGIIDTCERYAAAAIQKRTKLEEAPTAVSRLECLRAISEPSMRERHEASLQKEHKALEASRPMPKAEKKTSKSEKEGKKRKKDDEGESSDEESGDDEEEEEPQKQKSGTKKKGDEDEEEGGEDEIMQDDELEEGVDWSDEDASKDDEDDESEEGDHVDGDGDDKDKSEEDDDSDKSEEEDSE